MKIAVMGTGAMACLFAARLGGRENEVWMVSRWREQVEAISQKGLTLRRAGCPDRLTRPRVTMVPREVKDGGEPELVLVLSKGYQTRRVMEDVRQLAGDGTLVLTLQNGLGNPEVIAEYVPARSVFFGAAYVGTRVVSPGVVEESGNYSRWPQISLMPLDRVMDGRGDRIPAVLEDAGFGTQLGPEAEEFVWKKLCVNACGNAMAAVTRMKNSVFANDPDGEALLRAVCAELCAVARARGISADTRQWCDSTVETLAASPHFTSMGQDVVARRLTEIDTINGAVVSLGRELGVPTPVNETLTRLIRVISGHYEAQL